MTIFNTVQFDDSTKERMSTYESIMMSEFSRFEIQLIAHENKISFDWGVTSKPLLISMMKERNVPIPNTQMMQDYMKNHNARKVNAAPVKEIKEEVDKDDLSNLKRGQLVKMATAAGIKGATKMKNVDIIKELESGTDTTTANE